MRVKNTGPEAVWNGQTIATNATYDIQPQELALWQNDTATALDLLDGTLLCSDGSTNYKNPGAEALNFFLGTGTKAVNVEAQPAFASKSIGTKKLYTRATGASFPVVVGNNNLDFSIPFAQMKFNGLQIINGKIGETVNLKVLDTPTGTISGVPNYPLNQFGYSVNLPDGMFVRESQYDADLIQNMTIRIELTAVEARDFRVNYAIHELK